MRWVSLSLTLLFALFCLSAQDSIPSTSQEKEKLPIFLSVQTFFRNNEYNPSYGTGYTLPGYNLQMGVQKEYCLSDVHRVGFQLGVHNLGLMGAERYPHDGWYHDLPHWSSWQSSSPLHLRPIVALQYRPDISTPLMLTMGSFVPDPTTIRTVEPLRNPEYAYVADPLTGVRLQWAPPKTDIDLRLHWHGFIYPDSQHQEAFLAEGSVRHEITLHPNHRLFAEGYFSATHRGGEFNPQGVDTLHSFVAEAIGISYRTACLRGSQDAVTFSLGGYALFSQVREGDNHLRGSGLYATGEVAYRSWACSVAWWRGNRFVAPLAAPFVNRYPRWSPSSVGTPSNVSGYWSISPSFRLWHQKAWSLSLSGTLWCHYSAQTPLAFSRCVALDMRFSPF